MARQMDLLGRVAGAEQAAPATPSRSRLRKRQSKEDVVKTPPPAATQKGGYHKDDEDDEDEKRRRAIAAASQNLPRRTEMRLTFKRRILDGRLEGELGVAHAGGIEWYGLAAFRAAPLPERLDLETMKRLEKTGSVLGDRYTLPLLAPASVLAKQHAQEPAGGTTLSTGALPAERGLWTDEVREFFVSGDGESAGIWTLRKTADADDGSVWAVQLRKAGLPLVLQDFGPMPPDGESGLPASLEKLVPAEYRYWQAQGEDARAARDALIESGFFSGDNVALVNGALQRIETDHYLYEPPAELTTAAKALAKPATLADLVHRVLPEGLADGLEVFSPPNPTRTPPEVVAQKALAHPGEFLIEYPDSPAARAELSKVGRLFRIRGAAGAGRIFAASFPVAAPGVEWVEPPSPTEKRAPHVVVGTPPELASMIESSLRKAVAGLVESGQLRPAGPDRIEKLVKSMDERVIPASRIFKQGADELRYTLGVVLEPETVDAQEDIYSEDEIRQASWRYMQHYRNVKVMHKAEVDGKVVLVDNIVLPAAWEVAEGVTLKKGTWLMGHHWPDDDLWTLVKSGNLTGLSIGGSAVRKPEQPQATGLTGAAIAAHTSAHG